VTPLRSALSQRILFLAGLGTYLYFPVAMLWGRLSSNDFKHIYLGMKALLDGISPYSIQALHHQAALQGYQQISLNPYVYLPFTGHAMAFLAPFNLEQAVDVWFIVNHLLVFGSILIMSQMFQGFRIGAAGLLLLALAFNVPLYRTLSAGQLNLALLFMMSLAWYLMRKDRDRWAGAVLAFAALFKLMPGVYALYLLMRRKWTAAMAMAITGAFLFALSTAAAGLSTSMEFLPVLMQMGYGKSTWPHVFSFWDDPPNQSINSFFSHIMTNSEHSRPWLAIGQTSANTATWIMTLALISLYLWLTATRSGNVSKGFTLKDEAAWCATLILGLLIPSLMWDHYLVMLIFPVAWLVKASIAYQRPVTGSITVLCYIVTCLHWNFESLSWRSGPGIILMSIKLWPTLILFGLTLCFIRWSVEIVSDSRDKKLPEHFERQIQE